MDIFNAVGNYFTTGNNVLYLTIGIIALSALLVMWMVAVAKKQGVTPDPDTERYYGRRIIFKGLSLWVMAAISFYYAPKFYTLTLGSGVGHGLLIAGAIFTLLGSIIIFFGYQTIRKNS